MEKVAPFQELSSGRTLLLCGIALRILVFIFLAPLNNDTGHLSVIKYIVERHALPPITASQMAFQPPLYYLLAAPFYLITDSAKGVQVLSLLSSVLTLLIMYRLIYKEEVIEGERTRLYAFLLACFLPQFVLVGLYLSNDTLALFLGTLMIFLAARFVSAPNNRHLFDVALLIGLGLLTKGTFLAFLPGLFALIFFLRFRESRSLQKATLAALAFLLLSCGLGSYRFIENYREMKAPFASDLDLNCRWIGEQRQTYRGARSFVDINFTKLLASPTVDPRKPSVTRLPPVLSAYPLVLYGTFWYTFIQDSNFAVSRASFNRLGSIVYIFALIPTAVFGVGLWLVLKELPRLLAHFDLSRKEDKLLLLSAVGAFCLLGNLALLVVVTMKYHVWSVMTGRLLFPSFCGALLPFAVGVRAVAAHKAATTALNVAMAILVACLALYFGGEILHKLLYYSCFDAPYCG